MAVQTTRRLPDMYFELVQQFPLTHIRDDSHLGAAQEMIDRLLGEGLDEGSPAVPILTYLHSGLRHRQQTLRETCGPRSPHRTAGCLPLPCGLRD